MIPDANRSATFSLDRLLAGLADECALPPIEIVGLCHDSRRVRSGDLFAALAGLKTHGMAHARQAIRNGCAAIAFDPAGDGQPLAKLISEVPCVPVPGLGEKLGLMAGRFYGNPSAQLDVIAVTGTNGKTSVTHFIAQSLAGDRERVAGVIGTLGWGSPGALNPLSHTTPDAIEIQSALASLVAQGYRSVAMEASSHGLAQGRLNGVGFRGAVFTNFTRDHLDYHETMESYLEAKLKLLDFPGLAFLVFNADDPVAEVILDRVPSSVRRIGFTRSGRQFPGCSALCLSSVSQTSAGLSFEARFEGSSAEVSAPVFGDFNVENLAAALGVLLGLRHDLESAANSLATARAVPGRMERFCRAGRSVVVDYAHTPDALKRALSSLRGHCAGQLWVVFGCGGDRDRGKRAEMGAIASALADRVVLTDDNPRSEDGAAIIADIRVGCPSGKAMAIRDRREAIDWAIRQAAEGDLILVAGKGHETTQEIQGVKHPFNDRDAVRAALGSGGGNLMRLSDIAAATSGELMGADRHAAGVSIDTRTLKPDELYVAIKGARFDGNDFVDEAARTGASAAMVERTSDCAIPQILVKDGRIALGRLGAAWRSQWPGRLVGVTGSNGKTTVKEMVAAVLGVMAPVLKTQGNLNNDIGVPLTLLRLRSDHRYAVIEMGANHPGEIAYVANLARPDVAIIANAGAAHLEGFGSLQGVARAKGELVSALPDPGVAILNADDEFFGYWRDLAAGRRVVSFGFCETAEVRGDPAGIATRFQDGEFLTEFDIVLNGERHSMAMALAGRHNVANALAAIAVGVTMGLELPAIRAGLSRIAPVAGRLQPLRGRAGALLINDTYNANPSSFAVALDVLTGFSREPWVALGAFGELGEESAELHREIGRVARDKGIKRLFAVGPNADQSVVGFGNGAKYFETQQALIEQLGREITSDTALLIKGSRSQHMERVVEALQAGEAPCC